MMRQILFVAVDADQILERTGDAGFFVRLELREVDEHIGFDHFARNQILMDARMMRLGHQAMVVPGDAKSVFTIADRLQQAFAAQVEENELIFGL